MYSLTRYYRRFAFLTIGISFIPSVAAQENFNRSYSIEISPAQRLRFTVAESMTAPKLTVHEWGILAASPPEFEGQKVLAAQLRIEGHGREVVSVQRESSPLHQKILLGRLPVATPVRGSEASAQAE